MSNRRRKRPPTTPMMAQVEKFSHDGRGIARIDGKTTFIQGALPDETVMFQYINKRRDFDEGVVLSVIEPSINRVSPHCPHYSLCGGCSLQHLEESSQIHEKQALLLDLIARVGHTEPEQVLQPLQSDLWHYRNKARLSAKYVDKKQSTMVGFREKNNPQYIAEISQCPVLNARVDAEIVNLRSLIDSLEASRFIAQIEVAAGDEDIALIFRNLIPLCADDEEKIAAFGQKTNFRIYLQPGGADSVYLLYPKDGSDFLTYSLPQENITFQFHPTDFTQVNGGLNRLMVQKALDLLALEPEDVVLDLFCGLGNFSLPIAKHCAKVIGVEGSEAMVSRAKMNALANGLANTEFFSSNLEDVSALLPFKNHGITKLLIDPPRVGAMEIVKQISIIMPQRIVYVSCNPATLARDADILVNHHGYKLIATGVMDMFPHTAHVESIAVFELKSKN